MYKSTTVNNDCERKINLTANMLISLYAIKDIKTPFRLNSAMLKTFNNLPTLDKDIGRLKHFGLVDVYENYINDRHVKFYKISRFGEQFLNNEVPCSCYITKKQQFWEEKDYSYMIFSKEKKTFEEFTKKFNLDFGKSLKNEEELNIENAQDDVDR